MAARMPTPISKRVNVPMLCFMFIREISHGFDGTQDLMLMTRNFKGNIFRHYFFHKQRGGDC